MYKRLICGMMIGLCLGLAGCDLGTYEQRAGEPFSSKLERSAPSSSAAEGEPANVEQTVE